MNAPGGSPDQSVTQTVPGGLLPPLPLPFNQKVARPGKVQMNELKAYLAHKRAGKPTVDPLIFTQKAYRQKMSKLGYTVTSTGKVLEKGSTR